MPTPESHPRAFARSSAACLHSCMRLSGALLHAFGVQLHALLEAQAASSGVTSQRSQGADEQCAQTVCDTDE
eukprot:506571-Alexandrium_andersonii.AAC.1